MLNGKALAVFYDCFVSSKYFLQTGELTFFFFLKNAFIYISCLSSFSKDMLSHSVSTPWSHHYILDSAWLFIFKVTYYYDLFLI